MIHEQPGDASPSNLRVVLEMHVVTDGLGAGEGGALEGAVAPVQVRVGEITHVVDHHRVMRRALETERHAGPAPASLDLRDVGNGAPLRELGIPGEQPDKAVPDLHRIGSEREFRQARPSEEVRNPGNAALRVVFPAVIAAHQPTPFHLAQRQLELAMEAAVLDRRPRAVPPPVERDGLLPEDDLDHLSGFDPALFFDRVPVVRMHSGGARPLAKAVSLLEARRTGQPSTHWETSFGPPPRPDPARDRLRNRPRGGVSITVRRQRRSR